MIQKQIVYLPVKVEDELPEKGSKVFTLNSDDKKSVHHILDVLDENKDLYDKKGFLNFGDDSYVTHWLKDQEVFVFTNEQLNEYTANVIRKALETACERAEMRLLIDEENDIVEEANIDNRSIMNSFGETFKGFEV